MKHPMIKQQWLKEIIFYVTASHKILEEWPALLYNVASVHA